MRLSFRRDVRGHASHKLDAFEGTTFDKPFVLLTGPNGSGKSSVISMMRQVTGLVGPRQGMLPADMQIFRAPSLADFPDIDLAGVVEPPTIDADQYQALKETWSPETPFVLPKIPGVLDSKALGWVGQRTYLYDARDATASVRAPSSPIDPHFVSNLLRKVDALENSHGQMLARRAIEAIAWALGLPDSGRYGTHDPFDVPMPSRNEVHVNDAWIGGHLLPYELYEVHAGRPAGAEGRVAERWLFLDEPELALDVPTLASMLAVLVDKAEIGKLRVFCASHSPLWTGGLARHPNVQILDLGNGWFNNVEAAMASLTTPKSVARLSKTIAGNFKREKDAEAKEAKKRQEKEEKDRLAAEAKRAKRSLGNKQSGNRPMRPLTRD